MCHEYNEQGMAISGNYEIDPDGEGKIGTLTGDSPMLPEVD